MKMYVVRLCCLGFFVLSLIPASFAGTEANASLFAKSNQFLDKLGAPIFLDEEEEVSLRFDGEFRHRLEYREDFNFNSATFEDDGFNLIRTRLGMHAEMKDRVHFYVQAQDSESFVSRRAHKGPAFVNRLDLHQLFLSIKGPWEEFPVEVKVGRQELSYGDQRFVGAFGWSNVARVFDAVKFVFKPFDWLKTDMWFSRVVRINRSQPDSAQHDDNFYGIYSTLTPVKDHVMDVFLFVRHNTDNELAGELPGQFGQLKEYTVGNRIKGKKWGFDYGLEWAIQTGSRAHNDIDAWVWHNEIGYRFVDLFAAPRLSFEYNHGSGDSDPTDGKFENFDNLFPTNHIHYGFMDFQSLRNTHNFKVGIDLKPHKKVSMGLNYHWFFLDTNNSAWFNAGQGVIRAANSGASTTIGQEVDLFAKISASKHLNFLLGYSHFNAGAFIKDTGASDDANFFYVMSSLKI